MDVAASFRLLSSPPSLVIKLILVWFSCGVAVFCCGVVVLLFGWSDLLPVLTCDFCFVGVLSVRGAVFCATALFGCHRLFVLLCLLVPFVSFCVCFGYLFSDVVV